MCCTLWKLTSQNRKPKKKPVRPYSERFSISMHDKKYSLVFLQLKNIVLNTGVSSLKCLSNTLSFLDTFSKNK